MYEIFICGQIYTEWLKKGTFSTVEMCSPHSVDPNKSIEYSCIEKLLYVIFGGFLFLYTKLPKLDVFLCHFDNLIYIRNQIQSICFSLDEWLFCEKFKDIISTWPFVKFHWVYQLFDNVTFDIITCLNHMSSIDHYCTCHTMSTCFCMCVCLLNNI